MPANRCCAIEWLMLHQVGFKILIILRGILRLLKVLRFLDESLE
jgi:hypothetical protein